MMPNQLQLIDLHQLRTLLNRFGMNLNHDDWDIMRSLSMVEGAVAARIIASRDGQLEHEEPILDGPL